MLELGPERRVRTAQAGVRAREPWLFAWLTYLELGSAAPQQLEAAETSWEAGYSAPDFTLVLFNGPAWVGLRNTPYLCYSG